MGASDARERAILDAMFGSGNPATWYVGLTKAVPNDDGSGFSEPVGAGYARVAVTNNVTNWPAATTTAGRTVKKNGAKITWANPTGNWGNILGWGVFLALTGGLPEITQLNESIITPVSGISPVEFDIGFLEIEAE